MIGKKEKKYKNRIPIRGVVRCESENDCEGFSRFRDYICNKCYDQEKKSKGKK